MFRMSVETSCESMAGYYAQYPAKHHMYRHTGLADWFTEHKNQPLFNTYVRNILQVDQLWLSFSPRPQTRCVKHVYDYHVTPVILFIISYDQSVHSYLDVHPHTSSTTKRRGCNVCVVCVT